ncbi:MAG TPA: CoB--CoM heterodisulfide reductase iron-sulfur subunit B family protein [Terriglobales bacterium]|nr:CoB--CoM heterodisulfide reductase iron-sulfur subunit B family protein [Terriglobales bacterium]
MRWSWTQSYLYFPGCSLRTVARDFDQSAKACAKELGFELKEMQGWLCCGAVLSNVDDNLITKAGPNRILARAQRDGNTLVTLCAGCYNVLKRTDLHARQLSSTQQAINLFNEETFNGGVDVVHFLEVLRDRIGFDKIEKAVKVPLKRAPVGAYYGCLLLRPFGEMKFDDPNRPSILENLLTRLGCEPIDYPARTDCCGSYLSVGSPEDIQPLSQSIISSARASGAKLLAVSCPLCKYNLEAGQAAQNSNRPLPIVYFTQLLGLALGIESKELELDAQQTQAILENQTTINSVNRK